jgi:hypothetical protein
VGLDIHLHDTLHHTFAFINIHLDIHKDHHHHSIDRCFGSKEKASEKRNKFYASLCTKRREGVFRLRLKNTNFVHTKALYTLMERQEYITRYG